MTNGNSAGPSIADLVAANPLMRPGDHTLLKPNLSRYSTRSTEGVLGKFHSMSRSTEGVLRTFYPIARSPGDVLGRQHLSVRLFLNVHRTLVAIPYCVVAARSGHYDPLQSQPKFATPQEDVSCRCADLCSAERTVPGPRR